MLAGTTSAYVSVSFGLWPSQQGGCSQSANNPAGLDISASCSAAGAMVSASQSGWHASVSAGRNSNWLDAVSTEAIVTFSDSLIITGDSGTGFIKLGHWTTVQNASVTYTFAGQSFGCSNFTFFPGDCPPDPTMVPVTFGVPIPVQWGLRALGGCTGDGYCYSGFAETGLTVFSIMREDGSPSTARLQAIDSVPEPATIVLTVAGALLILVSRRKSKTL